MAHSISSMLFYCFWNAFVVLLKRFCSAFVVLLHFAALALLQRFCGALGAQCSAF
jgi:hypothetical protein